MHAIVVSKDGKAAVPQLFPEVGRYGMSKLFPEIGSHGMSKLFPEVGRLSRTTTQ